MFFLQGVYLNGKGLETPSHLLDFGHFVKFQVIATKKFNDLKSGHNYTFLSYKPKKGRLCPY